MFSGQETVLVMQGPKLSEEDSVGLDIVVITILTGGLEEIELVVGMELLLLVVLIEVEGGGEEKELLLVEAEEELLLVEETEGLLVEELDDDCGVEDEEVLVEEE
jgi:hypothetical protein